MATTATISDNIIRIAPTKYIHVLDNNTNTTRIEIGPATYIRREHEKIVAGPLDMIKLAPRTYCRIENPIVTGKDGKPVLTPFGEVKIRYGDSEVRTQENYPDPFPLYPGEVLSTKPEKFLIVNQNQAIRFVATRDFKDSEGQARNAGDEWVRVGPFTYVPRVEEEIVSYIDAVVIKPNTALKLRARKDMKDVNGVERKSGEEWLVYKTGAYLPQIHEEVVGPIKGVVLTDKKALRLRALKDFTDIYKIPRKAGEEWLVTNKLSQLHIKDVYEEIVGEVAATTLSNRQYTVVLDPFDPKLNMNRFGARELRKGEATFFLQPGESLENGVQSIEVLGEDEALLLRAREAFTDGKDQRLPGEKWMIRGPREYIPPTQVEIIEKRRSIPLDENEGIYVRNINTGEVRSIRGKTHLLESHEELWEKELPDVVEDLIAAQKTGSAYVAPQTDAKGNLVYAQKRPSANYKRDKTRVVTFRAPHNSAVQLYNFKTKESRVVFGPGLVMLEPDEQFTVIRLSGGKPKQENMITSLSLNLGPDFMTDVVILETSDHARLSVQLCYNWYFKFNKEDKADCTKLFNVKDFVGDACKSIASRVRGAASSVSFEDFHKNNAELIKFAVFGKKPDGTPKDELLFQTNNLCITSVDIQSVEPVDEKTRESLQKSVTLAIEIATKTQEMNATHIANKAQQESAAELAIQKLEDQTAAEAAKKNLLEKEAENASIASSGQAIADARAKAEALLIKSKLFAKIHLLM